MSDERIYKEPVIKVQVSYLALDNKIKTLEIDNSTSIFNRLIKSIEVNDIYSIKTFLEVFEVQHGVLKFSYSNKGVEDIDHNTDEKVKVNVETDIEIRFIDITSVTRMRITEGVN